MQFAAGFAVLSLLMSLQLLAFQAVELGSSGAQLQRLDSDTFTSASGPAPIQLARAVRSPVQQTPPEDETAIPDEELMRVCRDGTAEIAYLSGTPADIYVMNADGTDERRLTENLYPDSNISWSPDGSQIAYASQPFGNVQIWVMNADGTDARALTGGGGAYHPSWSPDGGFIVYTRHILGQGDIWLMNADGSNQRPVTTNNLDEQWPTWSPDGRQIAYVVRSGARSAIHIMDVNGTNVRELTNDSSANSLPRWSPDGETIAFTSDRWGPSQIFAINADGTVLRNLSNVDAMEGPSSWSPDGRFIAFFSNRLSSDPDIFDIYVMTADGTRVRRLTESDAFDENAVWRPCPGTVLPAPVLVPQSTGCTVSSAQNVNLRVGPGTNFNVEGRLTGGEQMPVIARTIGTDGFAWWQTQGGSWVRSDVVFASGTCDNVPFVDR